ncbi:MAG TPA: CDP-glucose 4,6-dehydratase [Polyangiaceae bacterium]|nr:CDP-glucose 4,6-dehydratase [Polyangiaceae bacterium]
MSSAAQPRTEPGTSRVELGGSVNGDFWNRRRVLVTGHTGFKGAWLTYWLARLGAEVAGYALEPATEPSLFRALGLDELCQHEIGDVRDAGHLGRVLRAFQPEVVLHLAAQAIVLTSYEEPVETFDSNVMGTARLLNELRTCPSVRACVVVTSDKCYENREWIWGYRELDPMGGNDPYSASKGAAELVTHSFRQSFFSAGRYSEHRLCIASARSGNVIGGGDFSAFRLVPDLARAFAAGLPAEIRNPNSVRPWQHVIDPLRGYLLLAQAGCEHGPRYARGWNFGPAESDTAPVAEVARRFAEAYGDGARCVIAPVSGAPHEAGLLRLDCSLARAELGFTPNVGLQNAVTATADWYREFFSGAPRNALRELTWGQLSRFGGVV